MVVYNMSTSNAVKAFLAILCCNIEVRSKEPMALTKDFNFGFDKEVIPGRPYFINPTLIYALCDIGYDMPTKNCSINVESDVFDYTQKSYSCDLNLQPEFPDRLIHDVIEVSLWTRERAIFVWREVTPENLHQGWVMIRIVHLRTCRSTTKKVFVDIRDNEKPEIFIIRSKISYDLLFNDKELCLDHFCKLTVYENGATENPVSWLPSTDLLYTVEQIDDYIDTNQLIVTVPRTRNNLVKFFLKRESEYKELTIFENFESLSWSTSNRVISICTCDSCFQFDPQGNLKKQISLKGTYKKCEILTLYNLPNGEQLTVICDKAKSNLSPNNYYRIRKIDTDGNLGMSLLLKKLKCSSMSNFISSTFFKSSNNEYCLALFHPNYSQTHVSGAKFSEYCFSLNDLSDAV